MRHYGVPAPIYLIKLKGVLPGCCTPQLRRCLGLCRSGKTEHAVDDVHHAVGRSIVRRRHCSPVDSHTTSIHNDLELVALKGLDFLGGLQVFRKHRSASNHVVLKHGIKLLDVGRIEQVCESGSRHLGEGLVGGGEDGEGARAGEGASKLASNESSDEGGE